jgi:hypothetical protein
MAVWRLGNDVLVYTYLKVGSIQVVIIIDEMHHLLQRATMDGEERVRRMEGKEALEVTLRLTVFWPKALPDQ